MVDRCLSFWPFLFILAIALSVCRFTTFQCPYLIPSKFSCKSNIALYDIRYVVRWIDYHNGLSINFKDKYYIIQTHQRGKYLVTIIYPFIINLYHKVYVSRISADMFIDAPILCISWIVLCRLWDNNLHNSCRTRGKRCLYLFEVVIFVCSSQILSCTSIINSFMLISFFLNTCRVILE